MLARFLNKIEENTTNWKSEIATNGWYLGDLHTVTRSTGQNVGRPFMSFIQNIAGSFTGPQ